jgi:GTP-binding protein EngB required for normal cell division
VIFYREIINYIETESSITYDQMMNKLNEEMGVQNEYKFSSCADRNLVLIGRTRTGKSTISNMIRDPLYMPPLASLFAGTRNITFNLITTTHKENAYFFTIIDSPGLYDSMRNEGERLNNNTIKKHLDQCITRDITHIHAFAFVLSSGSGINIEDIHSMIFIKRNYSELSRFFILIITHCEEKNEEERRNFMEEFFQHPDVIRHDLREFFGLGVFFTGCLRPQLQRVSNMMAARNQAANILEMRKELLDFLVARQETYNIHYRSAINPLLEKIRQGFAYFSICIGVLFVMLIIQHVLSM